MWQAVKWVSYRRRRLWLFVFFEAVAFAADVENGGVVGRSRGGVVFQDVPLLGLRERAGALSWIALSRWVVRLCNSASWQLVADVFHPVSR